MNNDRNDKDHHDTAFIDSTVQEKNVTYPTGAKPHKKIVGKVLKISKDLNLSIRQSYTFVKKKIYRDQRNVSHSGAQLQKGHEGSFVPDKKISETLQGEIVSLKYAF